MMLNLNLKLTNTTQTTARKNEAVGKAGGLLKMLLDYNLQHFAHFITDVIEVLSKLSLFLQEEQVTVCEVYQRVMTTCSVLEQFENRYFFY